MDRRESIKAIVATLSAAAVGTGIAVAASPDVAEPQEDLIARIRRKLKPLLAIGLDYHVVTEWDLCAARQAISVSIYDPTDENRGLLWSDAIYSKREAIGMRSAKSLTRLCQWRVDTIAWQILDRFELGDQHGQA